MPYFSLLSDEEAAWIEDHTGPEWFIGESVNDLNLTTEPVQHTLSLKSQTTDHFTNLTSKKSVKSKNLTLGLKRAYNKPFASSKLLKACHNDSQSLLIRTATICASSTDGNTTFWSPRIPLKSSITPAITLETLPFELRRLIFSYVVTVPQSVHIYEIRDSLGYIGGHGWRLSLCEEDVYDLPNCECRCQQGQNPLIQPQYFDNALLLVSRVTRREALDVFFSENKFTFCSFRDINSFGKLFSSSIAKIKSLRVVSRLSTYHTNFNDRHTNGLAALRRVLINLQNLDLHLRDSYTEPDGEVHEDFLIGGLCSFAFPRVSRFACNLHVRRGYGRKFWSDQGYSESQIEHMTAEFVRKAEIKLTEIFCGPYKGLEEIELRPHPSNALRRGLPPTNKRGMLALSD